MTNYLILGGVTALTILGAFAGLVQPPNKIDAQNRDIPDVYTKRQAFREIREQLQDKEVPFDPEMLLEPTWREDLKQMIDQIPEMGSARVLGEKVKGVQMAETLYLPERVKLTGDTLLLAKRIVFEGNNVVIKGNHNIYFMPLENGRRHGDEPCIGDENRLRTWRQAGRPREPTQV